jgi:hypothetical protein
MRLVSIAVLLITLAACGGTKKATQTYEPGCTKLYVDIEAGTLNGFAPKASMDEVKKQFPCFTGDSEEGGPMNCGGGVFFLEHDFYFYTGRDYLEVRFKFPGQTSRPLLSRGSHEIEADMGAPYKKETHDEKEYWFYKKKYGSLVVQFRGGKSYQFAMYTDSPDKVELCL